MARLNWSLERRLILVSAPSAYGKTTLLCEWLRHLTFPSAWITLDEEDDNLFVFVSYFLAAMEQLAPGSGEETRRLVAAAAMPPLSALVTALANDLADLPTEAVLVLDDFHTVAEPAIHELLNRLLAYLLPQFHLVISTRVDPPLSLVTLRANAQLAELRQQDLCLTQAESDAFLARVGPAGIDEETSAELAQRTGGWLGGMRLYLYSARNAEALKALTRQGEMPLADMTTYFTNEVLGRAPQRIQQFLQWSAITESFSLSLCRALFQDSFTEQTLNETYDQVQNAGHFITALGGGWYRYHALFRQVLIDKLQQQESPETIVRLHRAAADYYEGQGQIRLAIRHLLLVSEDEMAVELMERHRLALLNRSAWALLAARLAVFPTSMVTQYPELGMSAAWVAYHNSELNNARSILDRVEAQLAQTERGRSLAMRMSLEGEANAIRGQIFLAEGLPSQVPEHSRRALKLLPADHAMGRSLAYVNLVGSLNFLGYPDEARAELKRGVAEAAGSDDVF